MVETRTGRRRKARPLNHVVVTAARTGTATRSSATTRQGNTSGRSLSLTAVNTRHGQEPDGDGQRGAEDGEDPRLGAAGAAHGGRPGADHGQDVALVASLGGGEGEADGDDEQAEHEGCGDEERLEEPGLHLARRVEHVGGDGQERVARLPGVETLVGVGVDDVLHGAALVVGERVGRPHDDHGGAGSQAQGLGPFGGEDDPGDRPEGEVTAVDDRGLEADELLHGRRSRGGGLGVGDEGHRGRAGDRVAGEGLRGEGDGTVGGERPPGGGRQVVARRVLRAGPR